MLLFMVTDLLHVSMWFGLKLMSIFIYLIRDLGVVSSWEDNIQYPGKNTESRVELDPSVFSAMQQKRVEYIPYIYFFLRTSEDSSLQLRQGDHHNGRCCLVWFFSIEVQIQRV
jgi:hypothetical protein